jgi:purine-binding chemotaxis protein CheW
MQEDRKEDIIIEIDENEVGEQQQKKQTIRVISFLLGDENYCVDIKQIKEVVRPDFITKVPNTPELVVGIMNLRGEIISIINIKHILGLYYKERTKASRMIITDAIGSSVAIMVDSVKDTIDIEENAIQPPVSTLRNNLLEYTKGQLQIGKDILILLDFTKILSCEEIKRLEKEKRDKF